MVLTIGKYRKRLRAKKDRKYQFRANVHKFGSVPKTGEKTMLLCDLRSTKGKMGADHIWVRLDTHVIDKETAERIEIGDTIQFVAKTRAYRRFRIIKDETGTPTNAVPSSSNIGLHEVDHIQFVGKPN